MAWTKKKKSSKARKRSRRRTRRPRWNPQQTAINGFPNKILCKHRYVDTVDMAAGSGINEISTHIFSLSSLYDPDVTNFTGNYPRGYNQFKVIYGKYCVIGAKITVRPVFPQLTTTEAAAATCGLEYGLSLQRTAAFGPDNYVDLREEWGFRKAGVIKRDVSDSMPITKKYSLRKFFSHPAPLSDDVVCATSNQGPSKQAYCALWVCRPDGVAGFPITKFSVVIEYTTVWFERVPLAVSS